MPELVKLPINDIADVPARLRSLAEQIERGDYGEVRNLVWVLKNEAEVKVGLLGRAAEPQPTGYLLLAQGQRVMEGF